MPEGCIRLARLMGLDQRGAIPATVRPWSPTGSVRSGRSKCPRSGSSRACTSSTAWFRTCHRPEWQHFSCRSDAVRPNRTRTTKRTCPQRRRERVLRSLWPRSTGGTRSST